MKKFYFTTPLYYPNARLHAGHAYTTLVCDALARYKRLRGFDVAFLTGTDEHGEKLERAANEAGMSPAAFVAEKRAQIRKLWETLDISYTHFVYTDQPQHTVSVQRMLRLARKRQPGVIYKGRYQGRYCVYDERYISDGIEPVNCDICGRPAELISEENYFFKLSAFEERLLKLYRRHLDEPDKYPAPFVQPCFRLNEVTSFVKSGLRDISVSRKRIKWGVPWPDDPEQVFYVWYDALTGYLTGIGFAEGEGGSAEFQRYWPADIHMVGKDIIRFHAIYWPAFLMAAGLPLPESIVAHGWLLVGQEKMSKSKGNAVYVEPVVKLFESEANGLVAGSDVLRYYVLRDIPFGQDGSISYEGLIQRYNSDLANDLGNLANRTVTMINQYFGSVVPEPGPRGGADNLGDVATAALEGFRTHTEAYTFQRALESVWDLIAEANKYLVLRAPWAIWPEIKDLVLVKDGQLFSRLPAGDDRFARLSTILYEAAEAVRFASVLLYPIIPRSAQRVWAQLGCEGQIKDQRLDDLKWGGLRPGTNVRKAEVIFPRLDKEKAVEKLLQLDEAEHALTGAGVAPPVVPAFRPAPSEPTQRAAAPPAEPRISIEDFAKVDMRVGEILSAEPIPGAKKLLKLQVDIGTDIRQVCAGIAEHYRPEQLVGMKVVVVANLQPRKLRGIESNGMIVAASVGEEGKPVLATFKEDVPKGARLK